MLVKYRRQVSTIADSIRMGSSKIIVRMVAERENYTQLFYKEYYKISVKNIHALSSLPLIAHPRTARKLYSPGSPSASHHSQLRPSPHHSSTISSTPPPTQAGSSRTATVCFVRFALTGVSDFRAILLYGYAVKAILLPCREQGVLKRLHICQHS